MWAMVIDLNKCLGCQSCTVACKMLWSNREGADHMWFNITETRPGKGYPKNWEEKSIKGIPSSKDDYEKVPHFDYTALREGKSKGMPRLMAEMNDSPLWDEDIGKGKGVNDAWFFYLPISCMHCEDPKCIEACPEGAIYKRKDGVVLIDSELCTGHGDCVDACPYRRIFFNDISGKAEKCNMCFPRVEKGMPPICVQTCAARARFFGDLEDLDSQVYKLVKKYKVAIPFHAEFGTKPSLYYIPPVLGPFQIDEQGNPGKERMDTSYLEKVFGNRISQIKTTLETERKKNRSELMQVLTSYPTWKI